MTELEQVKYKMFLMFDEKYDLEKYVEEINGKYVICNGFTEFLCSFNNNKSTGNRNSNDDKITFELKDVYEAINQFKVNGYYFKPSYRDFETRFNKIVKQYKLDVNKAMECILRYADKAEKEKSQYNPLLLYYIYKEGVGSRLATDVNNLDKDVKEDRTDYGKVV